ncbi:hypothetical protein [Alicyclobacillus fastidiosus]|uniref:Uncharacterized protein n=1 Tax=Alicyclobacillus fastidiosus TaxID=392011 RepID=A0ABV5ALF6_9BACL|nr:hypothetical protein [Alicyclobacillus fastidiosus]WEH10252.1 hypothetical protein PYS47_03180 [Alicyclobacillus fastidiosus]
MGIEQECTVRFQGILELGSIALSQLGNSEVPFDGADETLSKRNVEFEALKQVLETKGSVALFEALKESFKRVLDQNQLLAEAISNRQSSLQSVMLQGMAVRRFARSAAPSIQGSLLDIEL